MNLMGIAHNLVWQRHFSLQALTLVFATMRLGCVTRASLSHSGQATGCRKMGVDAVQAHAWRSTVADRRRHFSERAATDASEL